MFRAVGEPKFALSYTELVVISKLDCLFDFLNHNILTKNRNKKYSPFFRRCLGVHILRCICGLEPLSEGFNGTDFEGVHDKVRTDATD